MKGDDENDDDLTSPPSTDGDPLLGTSSVEAAMEIGAHFMEQEELRRRRRESTSKERSRKQEGRSVSPPKGSSASESEVDDDEEDDEDIDDLDDDPPLSAAEAKSRSRTRTRQRSRSPPQSQQQQRRRPGPGQSSFAQHILSPSPPFSYVPTADTLTNAMINIFAILACVLTFLAFLMGSYDYFKNVESNKCQMTWMYHWPYYVPIPIGNGVDERFPMYGLYGYAEGEQNLDKMSSSSWRCTGIPVLYIPGNAGSYQQVRSLASVALWKWKDHGTNFHFDFFTVDLNEEFSALYGYTLHRQVAFVKEAVVKIVNLYEEFHRVVLVGHSMGGVIAKSVALGGDASSSDTSQLVNLILTLATPHHSPVTILDPEQDIFYHTLRRNWTKSFLEVEEEEDSLGSKVTLVSIAGGDRDHLVASKLTRWEPFTDLTVKTTGIPGVWASTDHLCIVWCKQLVLTLIRSLFDMVEYHQRNKYFRITDNPEVRLPVLRYHLEERSGGKTFYSSQKSSKINLSKVLDQTEIRTQMYCVAPGQRPSYLLIPKDFLLENVTSEDLDDWNVILLTTNTKDKNWLLGCTQFLTQGQSSPGQGQGPFCTQAENLSHLHGKLIPHTRRHRKMAQIPISTLVSNRFSHLVVKLDTFPFRTCLMLETYSKTERTRLLGGTFSSIGGGAQGTPGIFYNLTLPKSQGFLSNLASWKLRVEPLGTSGEEQESVAGTQKSCPNAHNLLAQFQESSFQQSRFLLNESLIIRSSFGFPSSSKNDSQDKGDTSSSSVGLYLEPSCTYRVEVTLAPLETAGQLFRIILKYLPSFYVSILLMALYYQEDSKNWRSFHLLLLSNSYRLSVFPGFCVAVALHFVPNDWPLMVDEDEYSVMIPIICYMVAYCLVLLVSTGIWYTIITGGTAVHSVVVRLLSTRLGSWVPRRLFGKDTQNRTFTNVTEHMTEAAFEMTLTRFPVTVAVLLLSLAVSTNSGSLAILLTVILYLVKLFKIYEDLLEDLLKAKIQNISSDLFELGQMNFHFACFMLWLAVGALNVPSLLHWTMRSSLGDTKQQPWDLSMYLCLLLLPTVGVLWQDFVPNIEPTVWKMHRYVFYAMGVACVIWGTHRLYVSAFLITFVFLTLALCQLVSVMFNAITNQTQNNQNQADAPAAAAAAEGQDQDQDEDENQSGAECEPAAESQE